jgi:hypothetical protein
MLFVDSRRNLNDSSAGKGSVNLRQAREEGKATLFKGKYKRAYASRSGKEAGISGPIDRAVTSNGR